MSKTQSSFGSLPFARSRSETWRVGELEEVRVRTRIRVRKRGEIREEFGVPPKACKTYLIKGSPEVLGKLAAVPSRHGDAANRLCR